MGVFRCVDGVARKVIAEYKGVNGIARKVVREYKGINGVARKIFGDEKLYLIRDGEYEVDFTTTSVWSYYPITNSSSKFKVTDAEEYIEVYNESYNMGGIITTDAIDLSKYSKINIEADVLLYVQNLYLENRATIGAYDSVPAALGGGTSNVWTAGEGTIFSKDVYYGTGDGTTVVPVSQSYDISSSELGHIFAYTTSFNLSSDRSSLRIKNLWLE